MPPALVAEDIVPEWVVDKPEAVLEADDFGSGVRQVGRTASNARSLLIAISITPYPLARPQHG